MPEDASVTFFNILKEKNSHQYSESKNIFQNKRKEKIGDCQ